MRSGDGVGGHGSRRLGSRGGEDEPLKLGPDGKPLPKRPTSERLRELWPDIWALVKPRRGILLLGLLLMAINRVSGLVLPSSTKVLVDDVIAKRNLELLAPLVLGVLGATLIQGATSFALTQLLSKAAQRLITELRVRVQGHIGRLPVSYYDANKTGALVSRIMSDVEGIRNLVGTGLVELVGGVMTALIAFFVLLRISPMMTIVTFTVLILFMLVLNRAFSTIRPIFRERGKINSEVTGRLTESLGAVRTVKGYHAEGREHAVFQAGVGRLLENVLKTLTATSAMGVASTVLLGFVGSAIMFVGANQVLSGAMTLGGFFTYTAFLGFLVAPVFQIVAIGTQLTEAFAGLERTREVLRERREDDDPRRTVGLQDIRGRITFEKVSFAYEADKLVLREVSFVSEPGTVTALVGSSGSGKSTMIGLVAAFHVPRSGVVAVDGIDLATVSLDSYRTRIGVVLQETFLFDGSIRDNVSFSRPGASEAEVLEACRIARVSEFAERFPEGYDTIVGERGVKLSGGQRQRVSIARAILADPRILILDEATSSLDSESEALIQEGLAHLMKGRTTFVIAHRLSTIRRADQILVVEDGAILERGSHEELFAARGRYHELYTKQHGLEANLFLAPGEGDTIETAKERGPIRGATGPSNALGMLSRRDP
ncbi:MAG: ABC transporter ATP-binding protein [Candidatus Eisenbacteria bacterium]|nr:ABC transporter ATP-binding protein [Candidatus Eisenbacteria bacterium]MCC7141354.1 ABC transporter ATP-binding protein [Candidatus Eisenbacteria bacterium]